ncbi:MAG: hypothetical protein ACLRFI_01895, partial [Alphaproteobacteria bacterium]
QDAPTSVGYYGKQMSKLNYCALFATEIDDLRRYAINKTLPKTICQSKIDNRNVAPLHGIGNTDVLIGISKEECICKSLGKKVCSDTDKKDNSIDCDNDGCKESKDKDKDWYKGLINWFGSECKCNSGYVVSNSRCVPESIAYDKIVWNAEGWKGLKSQQMDNSQNIYYCPTTPNEDGKSECEVEGKKCLKSSEANKCCNGEAGCE